MDEAADQDWSAVSLRVDVNALVAKSDIETILGPSQRQIDNHWTRGFGHSDDSLEHRLEELTSFLAAHRSELRQLATRTGFALRISFTPHEPQDHVNFSPGLIGALAEVGAYVFIDTYIG